LDQNLNFKIYSEKYSEKYLSIKKNLYMVEFRELIAFGM